MEDSGKPEALSEGSKAPHRRRKRLWSQQVIAKIQRLRTIYPNLGKQKLYPLLKAFCDELELRCPSPTTIGRIIADAPEKMRSAAVEIRPNDTEVARKGAPRSRKPRGFEPTYPGHSLKETLPYFFRRNIPPPDEKPILLNENIAVEEPAFGLWDYWQTLRRYQWLIFACTFVALVSAALYTFTRIPLYTAHTTVLIERRPPQVLKVQDAAPAEYIMYEEYYKTQYEILKSDGLAARVIRDEGLEDHSLLAGEGKGPDGERGLVAKLSRGPKGSTKQLTSTVSKTNDTEPFGVKSESIAAYLSMLEIKPVQGTRLVRVGFNTPDPALSARLANAHADGYVRHGIDLRSRTNEEAVDFLQKKLLKLKERVKESEAALNSYRRDEGIISLDDKSNLVVDRLADLNARLTEAEAERIAIEAQLQVVQKGNQDLSSVVTNSPVVQNLKAELARLEAEYAQYSKEFKPGYPRLEKLKLQIENTRRQLLSEIQIEVKGVESSYLAAKNKENALRAKMQEQKKAALNLKDSGVQYAILAREVDTNRQLYDSVLQRMKEMGVASEVRTSNVYVMDRARSSLSPSYPNKRRTLLLALLIGLAAGVGLAFLLEQLDNTMGSPEEVERYIRLPSLAVVPDFTRLNNGGSDYGSKLVGHAGSEGPAKPFNKEIVLSRDPFSSVAEAYRALRASMFLSRAGEPPQTVLFTSAARGEGKTLSVVNTAVVFAQMGARALIVDADLRRSRCHEILGVENGYGLAELLAGQIEAEKAIKPMATNNLFFLNAGDTPPNPGELLGSRKMYETLESLRERYDFIFIDSSPVMAVSDAV
ncbi:MAG: GumC family protein, partial [Candidatus Binatia bacterium]